MAAQYSSKHGVVGRAPAELFMAFTDLRNFKQMVPQDQKIAQLLIENQAMKHIAHRLSISTSSEKRIVISLLPAHPANRIDRMHNTTNLYFIT